MKRTAFFLIILAGVLWGTSGIFVHLLVPYGFSSAQMTFFRALVSALSILVCILLKRRSLLRVRADLLLLYAASGLGFFGTATGYFYSMQATSVSTAVMLMYTAPILVMLFSVLFFGEKLTVKKGVCVLAMFGGCILVSGGIGGLRFDLFGICIGLLSGISYSAYNILTKAAMRRGGDPTAATFYCFAFATGIAFFTCDPASLPARIALAPTQTTLLLLALGIFTCVLPYLLYSLSLKTLPAGTASALAIVEPMSATIFSVVLFHEPLDLSATVGILLILGAVTLLSKNES